MTSGNSETARRVLAALGSADEATLLELVGDPFALATLAAQPAIERHADRWSITPAAATPLLAEWQRSDPGGFRQLHLRAIAYLADQLRAGDRSNEPVFSAVFNRLADQLLLEQPDQFLALLESTAEVELHDPFGQQGRRFYRALGLSLRDRYEAAIDEFGALLAEAELDQQVRGRALNSRANCCRYLGRLSEALDGYHAGLALWTSLGNRLRAGLARLNLGITHYDLQQYREAEEFLQQATHDFAEAGAAQWLAAAHNELGLVYRDQGRWTEALSHLHIAEATYRAAAAADPLGRVLNNLGEVQLFQGQLADAVVAFQAADSLMQTRTYAVDVHLNLGLAQQVCGDLEQAQLAYQAALQLAQTINRRDILPHIHYRLGDVLQRQGRATEALAELSAAAEIVEQTRTPLRDEELKISLLGRWQQVYEALVLHCLTLGDEAAAFEWAERSRARAFAEAILDRSRSTPLAVDSVRVIALAEVQAVLPDDTAVLCYFTTGVLDRDLPLLRVLPAGSLRDQLLTPARTLLFVITRQRLVVQQCALDPNAFTAATPRRAIDDRLLDPGVLRRLSEALLHPLDDMPHLKRLYVIPHGPLHHVPFAAVLDRQPRELQLAYAPSTTLLAQHSLRSHPALARSDCLAVGYDGTQGQLRHTEKEAQLIADLTGGQALIDPHAKREQLRELSGDRRWLHFACHGQFNMEAPLDSFLEIAEGERLTAREILRDWRITAELVTLSACETGVSRILRGDEPLGLIRAFLHAGAGAVLVSQWPVEDLPTFLFMQQFYRLLFERNTSDLARALIAAQHWLRHLTVAEVESQLIALTPRDSSVAETALTLSLEARPFAHPRYWAAFKLIG
ncbi:hypothetical protein TFLX_00293 [Thermoflexales bacterium]|nr:hypothetical protein TFLX_00293 [Thermoflexales bacterium]